MRTKFYDARGEPFTNCPDCNTKLIDEFPETNYVGCSGCPRIFHRQP